MVDSLIIGSALLAPGDLTGDEVADLVLFDWSPRLGYDWPLGAGAFVLPGPLTERAVLHTDTDTIALAWPAGPWRGTDCGDLDLDGAADLCLATGIAFGPVAEGVQPVVTWSAVQPDFDIFVAACDLDGDAVGELLLWDPAAVAVHHLVTFPAGDYDPALLSDRSWTAPGAKLSTVLQSGDDLDGDGLDDFVFGWTDPYRSVVFVSSGTSAGGSLEDSFATIDGVYPNDAVFGDFDGDGAADLAFGGGSAVRLFRGPMEGGAIDPLSADATWVGHQYPDDLFGWEVDAADMDGDGRDDLVVGAPLDGMGDVGYPEPSGRVYLVYGGGL